jgi:hypothetical protein
MNADEDGRGSQGSEHNSKRSRVARVVAVGVVLALAVSCYYVLQEKQAAASDERTGPSPRNAQAQFIAHTDQVCLQFRAARESLTAIAYGSPAADLSPNQVDAYYGGLLAVTDSYMSALATLESPPNARKLIHAAINDAYTDWMLLNEAVVLYALDDNALFTRTAEMIRDRHDQTRPLHHRLRAYGFHTCGNRAGVPNWEVPG